MKGKGINPIAVFEVVFWRISFGWKDKDNIHQKGIDQIMAAIRTTINVKGNLLLIFPKCFKLNKNKKANDKE